MPSAFLVLFYMWHRQRHGASCNRILPAPPAVASAGVFGCLETFWGIALRHPRLRHEVLGLCANAWTQCGAAVQAACACASRSTTAIGECH